MTTIGDFHFQKVVMATPTMVQGWAEAFCEGTFAYSTIQPVGWTITACQDGGAPDDVLAACNYCGFCLVTLTANTTSDQLIMTPPVTTTAPSVPDTIPIVVSPPTTISTTSILTEPSSSYVCNAGSTTGGAGGYVSAGYGCGVATPPSTSVLTDSYILTCDATTGTSGMSTSILNDPCVSSLTSSTIYNTPVDTSGNVIGGDTGVVPIYAPATGGNTGAQDTTGALANTPSGGTNVTEYVILGGLILAVAAGALYMSRDKKQ